MKILKLIANNIKGIRCISIAPKSPLVKIEGLNASGKSSVLDSIETAIRGGRFAPSQPVRIGAEKGDIEIVLSGEDGKPKMTVKRTFTEKGTTALKVTDAEGKKYKSPQSFLDALADGLAFDPMEFFNLVGIAKVEMLKKALGLNFKKEDEEIEHLSNQRVLAFQKKHGAEHSLKKYEHLEKVTVPDVSEIKEKRAAAVEDNHQVEVDRKILKDLKNEISKIDSGIDDKKLKILSCEQRIVRLNKETEQARQDISEIEDDIVSEVADKNKFEEQIELSQEMVNMSELIDLSEFDEQIQEHSKLSVQAERYKIKLEAEKEYKQFYDEWFVFDGQINTIREQKKVKIAAAKMPVENMTFDEDTISINGVDIAQVNSAIQIETSLKIAMALNPKLKVIRIKSGSLLDDKSMIRIEEIAEKEGFQVWMEIVESERTSSDSFFISEGEIK